MSTTSNNSPSKNELTRKSTTRQALYRKYRPRSFNETVGQEAITQTLKEAVKSGRITHAYLFAGPRGVGKTTIARILAHEINSLPYKSDDFHLDIIEIDAASNRRIDEIRDLREKVHILPTAAKYKIYIIDEVHMLTKEAFNALLKTLEEPPAHCIFILATTEVYKLPETIISRTQRFNFKPVSKTAAISRLRKIAKAENIIIDDSAIELLAGFGDGSLRDIIGMLDQLNAAGKAIRETEIRDFLGLPAAEIIDHLLAAAEAGDPRTALELMDNLKDQAVSPAAVSKALSVRVRLRLLESADNTQWLTTLLKDLLEVTSSINSQESLELAILEAAAVNRDRPDQPQPPKTNNRQDSNTEIDPSATDRSSPTQKLASLSTSQWSDILNRIKSQAPSLYTALRLAEPNIVKGTLYLSFAFSLHQKKAQEARHIKLIGQAIEDITGAKLVIKCSVDKQVNDSRSLVPTVGENYPNDLKAISNIFGSAEVLES